MDMFWDVLDFMTHFAAENSRNKNSLSWFAISLTSNDLKKTQLNMTKLMSFPGRIAICSHIFCLFFTTVHIFFICNALKIIGWLMLVILVFLGNPWPKVIPWTRVFYEETSNQPPHQPTNLGLTKIFGSGRTLPGNPFLDGQTLYTVRDDCTFIVP